MKARVAAISVNLTPLAWEENKKVILDALEALKLQSVDLAIFPELTLSGYGCEDAFLSRSTAQQSLRSLKDILPATKGMAVSLGLAIEFKEKIYNCAALIVDGTLVGVNAKKNLPKDGLHYEYRWFEPWQKGLVDSIELFGAKVPFGDIDYRFQNGEGLYIEICEEAWVSPPSSLEHARGGVKLIANMSASHFARSKFQVRKKLIEKISKASNTNYVYANLIGCEAGRAIYDGGNMIASAGEILKVGERFGFNSYYFSTYDFELEKIESKSKTNQLATIMLDYPLAKAEHEKLKNQESLIEDRTGGDINKEFLLAATMGLFDYVRKSHSKGFIVSLSGGCDSSVCALLIAQMYRLAEKELGLELLCKRLDQNQAKNFSALIAQSLYCLYQKTENSSLVTENAAKSLAEELGAKFHSVSIDPQLQIYKELCESINQRKLTWQDDDIALQNIQARLRSPLPWMMANIHGLLMVSTSNRSEACVGYATMDGDTSGSISPIAGVDKHFLKGFLVWAEKECALGRGPTSSLSLVNEQKPTAELRPQEYLQEDEKDLMPYDILCEIAVLFVAQSLSPSEILKSLQESFPDFSMADLNGYLVKFLTLFSRNQWKRERFAPSFHLDDTSVDPKSYYRFPILNGGFHREVSDLDA